MSKPKNQYFQEKSAEIVKNMKSIVIVKDCVVHGVLVGDECVVTAVFTRDALIMIYAVQGMAILV